MATVSSKKSIGSSSTKIVDANLKRMILRLINDSDEAIYIKTTGDAAVINEGVKLAATGTTGDRITIDNRISPQLNDGIYGEVYGICSSGSKNLCYEEIEFP